MKGNSIKTFRIKTSHLHIDQILLSILIVKQGWIKTAGVRINRIGPWPFDVFRRHNIIVRIFVIAVDAFDVCIDQPEQTIRIRQ